VPVSDRDVLARRRSFAVELSYLAVTQGARRDVCSSQTRRAGTARPRRQGTGEGDIAVTCMRRDGDVAIRLVLVALTCKLPRPGLVPLTGEVGYWAVLLGPTCK
jgi:hypothetical protein